MRILLLTQYFPPENGAAQNRLADLAFRLLKAGHDVTVLTSMPNYPQGRIFEQYRGKVFCSEQNNGVRIVRNWCYVSRKRAFMSRLLNYCSFAFIALISGVIQRGKQDAIIVESPPLFLGITGHLLGQWHSTPVILNVSDLWPESAVSMGVLRNRNLIRLASSLEKYLYQHSFAITGQTQGIVDHIKSTAPNCRVELIPNGVDPSRFANLREERQATRAQFCLGNRFVVGYTGLHGLAQGLGTLLEAAELLQSRTDRILLAFFGDGPEKAQLEEAARIKGLSNVVFIPPQPSERMPAILDALDAAIVPLRNLPLFSGALPSKLFECMAAGLPIVLAISPGEATRLIERSGGGICVPPENAHGMAAAIERLAADPKLCEMFGTNGKRFVHLHYDRREIAKRFLQLLPLEAPGSVISAVEEESVQL